MIRKRLLRFDHVKRSLEDQLFENGVEIVYVSNVVQALADGEKLQGIVIGNKSGRQAILSKLVLDCTETASVVRLTDQEFEKSTPLSRYGRTLEFTNVEPITKEFIIVPPAIKIRNNRVKVQRGYIGNDHYYIECPMDFESPKFDAKSTTERESEGMGKVDRSSQVSISKRSRI